MKRLSCKAQGGWGWRVTQHGHLTSPKAGKLFESSRRREPRSVSLLAALSIALHCAWSCGPSAKLWTEHWTVSPDWILVRNRPFISTEVSQCALQRGASPFRGLDSSPTHPTGFQPTTQPPSWPGFNTDRNHQQQKYFTQSRKSRLAEYLLCARCHASSLSDYQMLREGRQIYCHFTDTEAESREGKSLCTS